jgi:Periplasmic protease
MNKRFIILFPFIMLIAISTLMSCVGEDRWAEYKPLTATNEWMDSVMRVNYYWAPGMPSSKKLNYFNTPTSFLSSVKSNLDKVSHIDSIYNSTNSYGITASLEVSADNDTVYNAAVTYVNTDSPAYRAGLKRGDWIMKVGGNAITRSNQSTILANGNATTLSLGTLQATTTDGTTTYSVVSNGTVLSMDASTSVSDNPVHYYTTITSGSKKIGYLVYSSFNAGTSNAYLNSLRSAFASFSSNGVTDFVLDLRYNGSGDDIECARLLASMLVPSGKLGSTFVTLKKADSSKDETLALSNDLIGSGANLNLSTIYILTTSATAQLSEVLIAALVPYLKVYTVGSTTKGVLGVTTCYTNPAFNYKFYPVTSIPVNASNEIYETSGIVASKSASDTDLPTLLDFGNINESMLSAAIVLITAQ